jgi:hypothetical protein
MILSSNIFIRLISFVNLVAILCLIPLPVYSGGIATIEQTGDFNSSLLIQDGFENEGIVIQLGDENTADLSQENPQDQSGNRAFVKQGTIDGCIGCVATVNQVGAGNFVGILQDGEDNETTVNQNTGGDDNLALVGQFGDNNQATFNQEGDNNTGLSAQLGDNNAFVVNQLNDDNFISVNQFGGAGSGPGGPITVTQEGGQSAIIVQESVIGN